MKKLVLILALIIVSSSDSLFGMKIIPKILKNFKNLKNTPIKMYSQTLDILQEKSDYCKEELQEIYEQRVEKIINKSKSNLSFDLITKEYTEYYKFVQAIDDIITDALRENSDVDISLLKKSNFKPRLYPFGKERLYHPLVLQGLVLERDVKGDDYLFSLYTPWGIFDLAALTVNIQNEYAIRRVEKALQFRLTLKEIEAYSSHEILAIDDQRLPSVVLNPRVYCNAIEGAIMDQLWRNDNEHQYKIKKTLWESEIEKYKELLDLELTKTR